MQAATATATTAAQIIMSNEFDVQGRVRYVWSGRRHNVENRDIGLRFILPKQFVQLVDITLNMMDYSAEAFGRRPGEGSDLVVKLKTSLKIVDELRSMFPEQDVDNACVMYLEALTDVPHAVVLQLEAALLPNPDWKLPQCLAHLSQAQAVPASLKPHAKIYEQTRQHLIEGHEAALAWCQMQVKVARDGYEERMRGGLGQPNYNPVQRSIAAEIGEELKEGQTIQVEQLAGAGVGELGPALLAMVQQQGNQFAAVMAELADQRKLMKDLMSERAHGKLPPSLNPDPEEPMGEMPDLPPNLEEETGMPPPSSGDRPSVKPPVSRKK